MVRIAMDMARIAFDMGRITLALVKIRIYRLGSLWIWSGLVGV